MSENQHDNHFRDLRTAFESLEVDDQARFLVEAALSLVANGAKEAGNVVSSVVDDLAETLRREWHEDTGEEESGPTSTSSAGGSGKTGTGKKTAGSRTGTGRSASGAGKGRASGPGKGKASGSGKTRASGGRKKSGRGSGKKASAKGDEPAGS